MNITKYSDICSRRQINNNNKNYNCKTTSDMYPQGSQQALLGTKIGNDPTLTLEIDGSKELETVLDLEDKETVMRSIFDSPDHTSNIFNLMDAGDDSSIIRELGRQGDIVPNKDRSCHYTASAVTSIDHEKMLTSDFETYSSPPCSTKGRKFSFDTAQTVVDFDFSQINQSTTPFSVSSTGALELDAQSVEKDRAFDDFWRETTQKINSTDNLIYNRSKFKVGKPRNHFRSGSLQSFLCTNNMDLNYLFHCDDFQHISDVMPSLRSVESKQRPIHERQYSESSDSQISSVFKNMPREHSQEQVQTNQPRPSSGRPRKEKRTKCLKRDSTVTLEQKLDYFKLIVEDAKKNNIPGIFLRDHAAGELSLEKTEHCPLELGLPNFGSIGQHLDTMLQKERSSFRTVWRVVRTQCDNQVCLNFFPSDETSPVPKGDMEISVFALIVPGHSTKYLVTSCQYLELVNFVLGKSYNHLINDNLAETTVGSDGKMISTQKHHASRVRSHVKKFLRRHVVKDLRKYTDAERCDVKEFEYRMALHNLVLQCHQKRPFESKVSIALMELENVEKALLKQSEFFTFKKV